MTDIPQALVEKAAEALDDGLHRMHGIVSSCDHHEEARTVLAAVWADVAAARPVVDRDALAWVVKPIVGGAWADEVAGRVLASGVIADAADVRRQTAEDIAAALEAYAMEPEQTPGFDVESALFSTMRAHEHAARIAREVGGRDE